MDALIPSQTLAEHLDRKSPTTYSAPAEVLLIQRKEKGQLYTDEVLQRAGFWVRTVTPSEAAVEDGHTFPLVVFSNTLSALEVAEIGAEFRRRSPRSRLLLLLGPDSANVNGTLFDAMLEGLEGPAALVRMARLLANGSMDGVQGISA